MFLSGFIYYKIHESFLLFWNLISLTILLPWSLENKKTSDPFPIRPPAILQVAQNPIPKLKLTKCAKLKTFSLILWKHVQVSIYISTFRIVTKECWLNIKEIWPWRSMFKQKTKKMGVSIKEWKVLWDASDSLKIVFVFMENLDCNFENFRIK